MGLTVVGDLSGVDSGGDLSGVDSGRYLRVIVIRIPEGIGGFQTHHFGPLLVARGVNRHRVVGMEPSVRSLAPQFVRLVFELEHFVQQGGLFARPVVPLQSDGFHRFDHLVLVLAWEGASGGGHCLVISPSDLEHVGSFVGSSYQEQADVGHRIYIPSLPLLHTAVHDEHHVLLHNDVFLEEHLVRVKAPDHLYRVGQKSHIQIEHQQIHPLAQRPGEMEQLQVGDLFECRRKVFAWVVLVVAVVYTGEIGRCTELHTSRICHTDHQRAVAQSELDHGVDEILDELPVQFGAHLCHADNDWFADAHGLVLYVVHDVFHWHGFDSLCRELLQWMLLENVDSLFNGTVEYSLGCWVLLRKCGEWG